MSKFETTVLNTLVENALSKMYARVGSNVSIWKNAVSDLYKISVLKMFEIFSKTYKKRQIFFYDHQIKAPRKKNTSQGCNFLYGHTDVVVIVVSAPNV